MKLKEPQLEDRSFLIQFHDILGEFWHEIPWLQKIENLKYVTNADVFRQELIQGLWLDSSVKINSYILTTDDQREEYLWWLLHFSVSPEVFKDKNNETIRKQLECTDTYSYVTCLQIRDVFRTGRYGVELFSKWMDNILREFPKIWWVISQEKLIPYYRYFGGKIVNTMQNKDWLAFITFDEKSFIKRH